MLLPLLEPLIKRTLTLRYFLPFCALVLMGCGLFDTVEKIPELILVSEADILVPEPSGLTLDAEGGFLFCVSDPPSNQVHKLDLSGHILNTLTFVGDDLEGISFDPRDETLWVVDELQSDIIHLSTHGVEISRTKVNHSIPDPGEGLEGIVFNQADNDFFTIKQKNPAAIIYIDSNLVTQNSKTLDLTVDITGICQGPSEDEYFLISAGEKRLWTWSWDGGFKDSYRFDVKQAEGVAYNPINELVYIVCDSESILYTFRFPE